ncbi:hypothetical protein [Shewanella waksmanii]|uniref:hypothetical protein n=1 Tax=Shewanella waksmanii TaxID=213783 RepID=UPI003736CF8E
MNKAILILIALLGMSSSIKADELHIYQDPVPVGDYVKDEAAMLTKALARTGWVYDQQGKQQFARLNYKGYQVNVELVHQPAGISLKLLDASRPDCGKKRCEADMDKVTGWLVKLRRNIAYELTLLVRDDAIRRSYAL